LRFPVHNPEGYEFLPTNAIVNNCIVNGLYMFAAFGDVIILWRSDKKIIAISQSTLCPIDGFEEEYRIDCSPKYWQIFGENYLVFPEREYSRAKVFDIRNAQFFTTAPRDLYKKIYDNIYYKILYILLAGVMKEKANTMINYFFTAILGIKRLKLI